MKDLIEALTIMLQYAEKDDDVEYPFQCEHDTLFVWGVKVSSIPFNDIKKLIELGFLPGMDDEFYIFSNINSDFDFDEMTEAEWNKAKDEISECFHSFKYGSC